MKKAVSVFAIIALIGVLCAGCAAESPDVSASPDSERIRVTETTTPGEATQATSELILSDSSQNNDTPQQSEVPEVNAPKAQDTDQEQQPEKTSSAPKASDTPAKAEEPSEKPQKTEKPELAATKAPQTPATAEPPKPAATATPKPTPKPTPEPTQDQPPLPNRNRKWRSWAAALTAQYWQQSTRQERKTATPPWRLTAACVPKPSLMQRRWQSAERFSIPAAVRRA